MNIGLKNWIWVGAMAALGCLSAAWAEQRPNMVLIIADDLGAEDVGAYGCEGVRTPNLDRLAKEGMKFNRAFNSCSSCSPSRCSIVTGRYPHSTGAEALHKPLPKEQVTFVEKLKAAGYWTAQAGKWHLGDAMTNRFDATRISYITKPKKELDGSGCEDWVSTLRERPQDKPFFVWLASHDPHRPYFPDAVAEPTRPGQVNVPPYLPDVPPTREDLALYYDEIVRFDGYVGQVLAELERQGVLESTAVFFITDNGRPFPRSKTSVYDSGIQSPLLVRWPEKVQPGSECNSLVSMVDLAPTLLEMAGLPASPTFQGQSFRRLLADPSATIRDWVFAEHNWHDYAAFERAVRTDRFKYIRNYWPDLPATPPADAVRSPTFQEMQRLHAAGQLGEIQSGCFVAPRPAEELYDVQADPQELNNLAQAGSHPEVLQELRAVLDKWQRETGDAEPEERTIDGFSRETGEALPGIAIRKS